MLNDVTPPRLPQRPKPIRIEPPEKPEAAPLHEQAKAEDPTFKTPEEVAAAEESEPSRFLPMVISHERTDKLKAAMGKFGLRASSKVSSNWASKGRWHPTRKQWIIGGSILAVLIAVGIGAAWTLTHDKRAVVAVAPKKHIVKKVVPPPIIYSTLTGLPVADASVNQRPVTAAMIENSLDARPQSGLSEAGVVFEAVAEGGVTRFMALFQDTAPADIGPIRSARPYYVQWALGFDAAYAHVGGSPDALADISSWSVKDMNQFSNGAYYHRITSRAAPHNVYTSIATLNELEAAKGYTSTYTGFTRAKKDTPVVPPTATSIDFQLSGAYYDPHYDYNGTTNSYDRSEYQAPHMDAGTGKQISPKVVIAMVVPLARGELDSSGAYYSDYQTIGSGQAYIFQNGTVTVGTWNKASNAAPLVIGDPSGQPLPLNPGQTWITAVSSSTSVTYK